MAIAVTTSKAVHRGDNVTVPVLTVTGASASPANRLIANKQSYTSFSSGDSPISFTPLNRTELLNTVVRKLVKSTSTLTSIVLDAGIAYTNRASKAALTGDGWHGAVFANAASSPVGIELKPTGATSLSTYAISLQNDGTPSFNFLGVDVPYALVFGQNGAGSIWEGAVVKLQFPWLAGDTGYIELRSGIVRYWLIRAGVPRLLRTVRTTLAYPVAPVFTLYHQAGTADVTLFLGDEASVAIQVYGIMDWNLQDLQNPQTLESLGERTVTKDKKEDFTYYTDETNLVALSLSLAWRFKAEYQAFREFVQYHDRVYPFIFVDKAREKLMLDYPSFGCAANEMFAKFTSDFKDNPIGADLYGASVDLRQLIDPPQLPVGA